MNRRVVRAMVDQELAVLSDEEIRVALIRLLEIPAGDDETVAFWMR